MTVDLGEAVSAIAASLVSARRTLDAATVAMGEAYDADPRLRSLPVPSYSLAEATFEVPYVIAEVVPAPSEPPKPHLPRRPVLRVAASETSSLLRGVDEQTAQRLNVLLEEYAGVSDLYARARTSPSVLATESIPPLPRPTPSEIRLLKTGASKAAQEKLDRLLADFQDLRATLTAATQTVREAGAARLLVRLDAEALAEAPPERIQRARFTFRDQPLTSVDVDDATVTVAQ